MKTWEKTIHLNIRMLRWLVLGKVQETNSKIFMSQNLARSVMRDVQKLHVMRLWSRILLKSVKRLNQHRVPDMCMVCPTNTFIFRTLVIISLSHQDFRVRNNLLLEIDVKLWGEIWADRWRPKEPSCLSSVVIVRHFTGKNIEPDDLLTSKLGLFYYLFLMS